MNGPPFLWGPPEQWPALRRVQEPAVPDELIQSSPNLETQDFKQFTDWAELLKATQRALNGGGSSRC